MGTQVLKTLPEGARPDGPGSISCRKAKLIPQEKKLMLGEGPSTPAGPVCRSEARSPLVTPARHGPTNRRTGCLSPPLRVATPALPPPSPSGPAARATATDPSAPASVVVPCWLGCCHLSLRLRRRLSVVAGRRTHAGRGLTIQPSGGAGPVHLRVPRGGSWPLGECCMGIREFRGALTVNGEEKR